MEEASEIQEVSFLWKIENYREKIDESDVLKSAIFKIGTDDCVLEISKMCDVFHVVCLIKIGCTKFSPKAVIKICLMNDLGEEYLIAKRTGLSSDIKCIPLIIVGHDEYILEKRHLTLRFSWLDQKGNAICERTTSDLSIERVPKLQPLSVNVLKFSKDNGNTDCLLRVGDTLIPVHKTALSARSVVFKALFLHDTPEKRNSVVDIPDVDATVLNDVLSYIYSGQICGLFSQTAAPMFVMADKYAMLELRSACLDVLKQSMTVGNVCDIAVLAYSRRVAELEEKVEQFVEDKLEIIEETHKWVELLKYNPSIPFKLVRSALMNATRKNVSSE